MKVSNASKGMTKLTKEIVSQWKAPPFQRPLRNSTKLKLLREAIKVNNGIIRSVIVLGVLGKAIYLLDGQHRIEAFLSSEVPVGYVYVCIINFDTMDEMGEAYIILNDKLVQTRPDDILRAKEPTHRGLQLLRERVPFVGYDMIRRGGNSPILSASVALRAWFKSATENPQHTGNTVAMADSLTEEEAKKLSTFLHLCEKGWGRDQEYQRLWASLNLTMTGWLYRRSVLGVSSKRRMPISQDLFVKCLMAMSESSSYLDWLGQRSLKDRDRGPCYRRIKQMFVKRLLKETGLKFRLPSPPWDPSTGRPLAL